MQLTYVSNNLILLATISFYHCKCIHLVDTHVNLPKYYLRNLLSRQNKLMMDLLLFFFLCYLFT